MKRKKSITIEESGIPVRIFKRGDRYYLDVWNGRDRTIVAAKTRERDVAETNARAFAKEIATQRLIGVTSDTLTLGQLFTAYQTHRGSQVPDGQWRRAIETRQRLFLAAWGESLPVASISQTSVDTFSAARRSRYAAKKTADGKERVLRDGALDSDFRWLSSAFNWATRHKLSTGKRLLMHNPLHDCKWPREKNVRRPIASHERYTKTVEKADAVDSRGRLRAILALARYTGRRESAIIELRESDILLSKDRLASALAASGMDERLAEKMPHGAIRWAAESDKMGVLHLTPISPDARAEVERYFKTSPRGLGDAPLFPSVERADQPISRSLATKWLVKAEKLAKLPKLVGGIYHPYRRLWATERQNLSDTLVASAGGWKSTKTLKIYQQADAAGVLAAVLNAG